MNELARERPVLKPAQLNALARNLLEDAFAQVWVQGEISNFSRPGSGHMYFTLKDDRAQVRCALFKQKSMYLRFIPRDGQQVLVRGRLTVYEARGDYQLILEHMEEAGEGALRQAFDALKNKLAAEGLFAGERKRALPRFPRHLALITSPRGAAVHDVLNVLARRFPLLPVDVLPVPVQGDGAALQIRNMLARANDCGRYDLIVLARGGGSLEDLWAFNDEALVRAIAASPVPVVSAVGHEIDFSLADLAADVRAATPSAAAELIAPQQVELSSDLGNLHRRLQAALQRQQRQRAQRSDQAFLRLQSWRPQLRVERGKNRLASLRTRLDRLLLSRLETRLQRVRRCAEQLQQVHPRARLSMHAHRSRLLEQRLGSAIQRRLGTAINAVSNTARALHAVSPFATLARGYAIITDAGTGSVLRRAADAHAGQSLDARLSEGVIRVIVDAAKD